MNWSILVLTLPARMELFAQLRSILIPQIAEHENEVEVRVHADTKGDPKFHDLNLGEKREHMRRQAQGQYISFIDDDDLIHPQFVEKILPLLDGVDQVGFDLKCFCDRRDIGVAHHSLKFGKWTQTVNARVGGSDFYRDISHLNPMRRDLALLHSMEGGVGEDCRWANAMRASGKVKTEHYIEEILYFYPWRGNKNDSADARDPWRLKLIEDIKALATT